jgi:uncharacterized protein YbjT (DUF2867 family)
MTTLVTGSRGRVARALTTLLTAAGEDVRAGSRAPEAFDAPPGVTPVPLDLADPVHFGPALKGVDAVFLYASSSHAEAFLSAAADAGVGHVLLLSSSSVLARDAERDPLARHHVEVEQALAASPLTASVLRPGAFAGNALQWARPIRATGTVRLPYPGAHTDPVHEADLAAAAFTVLAEPARAGRTYQLTGPQSLSFAEQIGVLGRATGQRVRVEEVGRAAWKADMAEHLPAGFADALLDLWQAYDGRPVGLTDTLEWLVGRPPRTFAGWAEEHAAAFTR